jgi:hypothetical protein
MRIRRRTKKKSDCAMALRSMGLRSGARVLFFLTVLGAHKARRLLAPHVSVQAALTPAPPLPQQRPCPAAMFCFWMYTRPTAVTDDTDVIEDLLHEAEN